MRILLPTMRDPGQIGGTSTHIAMLLSGLRELGHEAEALWLGEAISTPLRKAGLVWPAGTLNRLRAGWGMMYAAESRARLLARVTRTRLKKASVAWEVLNAQEPYSVPYLREVADEFGLPLVLTLHGYPLYESLSEGYTAGSRLGRHYLMRVEMRALRLADAVVTVDSRLYRHALGLVPEKAECIHTLMNFIDTAAFSPPADPEEDRRQKQAARAAWGIPEDRIVLFCPRRLVKKNGVIYPSLALAAMAPSERERFLLLHAGEGGERDEIERIVRENELQGQVRLLGGQGPAAIRELYRLADIVLVPSVHSENVEEATSLSALEAMASGRPLIAGAVGGLAEIVVDGKTGLLVSVDPQALAAAILRLAAAPDLGARLAAAARRYVEENHSHVRAAAAYVEVYRRAQESSRRVKVDSGSSVEAPAASAWTTISVLGFPLDLVPLEQAARWVAEMAARDVSQGSGGLSVRSPSVAERSSSAQTGSSLALGDFPSAMAESPSATAGSVSASAWRPGGRTALAVSFNPELVMRARKDPAVAEVLFEADLCYPDGVGAVWAAARQGATRLERGAETDAPTAGAAGWQRKEPERVPGIELAERVLELAAERGLPVYFLGAARGVAEAAAEAQRRRLPTLLVAGTYHGYFGWEEEPAVVQRIRDSGARILLAALGAPRQELFLHRNRDTLGVGVALGVGGSFDVWAGRVKRAPEWAQKAKVEWLYRLARDPRRLARQAVLPRYAFAVLAWCPDDYGPPKRRRPR